MAKSTAAIPSSAHDPISAPDYLKKKVKPTFIKNTTKALIITTVIFALITLVLSVHYFSLDTTLVGPLTRTQQTTPAQHRAWVQSFQAGEDDEKPPCEHVGDQPDPCKFVTEIGDCESDGLINWLEFRYCTLDMGTAPATLITLALTGVLLVVFLTSLGTTADVFFVPSLTTFADILHFSPAVAGLTLVSLGNASPDLLSTISTVGSGDLPMVLGSLTGAAVCLSLLTMGAAIFSAPEGQTTLTKHSFIRNMSGYIICIGSTIVLGLDGKYTIVDATIFLCLYCLYVAFNVVYLQRQEGKLRSIREVKRKQKFLQTTTSYHLLKRQLIDQTGVFEPLKAKTSSSRADDINAVDNDFVSQDNATTVNTEFFQTKPSKLARQNTEAILISAGIDRDVIEAVNSMEKHHQHQSQEYQRAMRYLMDDKYHYIFQENDGALAAGETKGVLGTLEEEEEEAIGGYAKKNDDDASMTTTLLSDDNKEDGDDNEPDSAVYMEGISWPNPEWEEQGAVAKRFAQALWILSFPLSLMRWLSIPCTEQRPDVLRGLKSIFTQISPIFLALTLCVNVAGLDTDYESNKMRVILLSVGIAVCIGLNLFYYLYVVPRIVRYNRKRAENRLEIDAQIDQTGLTPDELHELTERYMRYDLDKSDFDAKPFSLTLYQAALSLLAFIASISWLSLLADQIVSILQAIGVIFTVKTALLGLTVLAIGNSFPDIFSNMSLAGAGQINTAYSAMFSAPMMSNTFGFALALLLKFAEPSFTGPKHLEFEISGQLILCWATIAAAALLHCIVFPMSNWTPSKKYGIVLISSYFAFLVVVVIVQIIGK